jgi:hypothetical protein
MVSGARAPLNLPRPARVRAGRGGIPLEVDGLAIEEVRESWLVEDRWWTAQPLRRRYWEAVTRNGRNVVVFHDLTAGAGPLSRRGQGGTESHGGWFLQGP